jgi:hypothetical protein
MLSHKTKLTALFAVGLWLLGACGGSQEDAGNQVLTQAAEIASQGLTQTAAAAPPTDEPEPSSTVTFLPTNTPRETLDALPTNALGGTLTAEAQGAGSAGSPTPGSSTGGIPTNTLLPPTPFATPTTNPNPSSGAPCHRANLEWENIPDGTEIQVGKNFEKAWRLKNIGTCTWTAGYSLIWVQGELFNAASVVELPADDLPVPPNGYVTVRVPMRAPNDPGDYQGYWMIRSQDGNVFGVGLQGTEWFWLLVDVYNPDL